MKKESEKLLEVKRFLKSENKTRKLLQRKMITFLLLGGGAYVALSAVICLAISSVLPALAIALGVAYLTLTPFIFKMTNAELEGFESDVKWVKEEFGTLESIETALQQIEKLEKKEIEHNLRQVESPMPFQKEEPKRLILTYPDKYIKKQTGI